MYSDTSYKASKLTGYLSHLFQTNRTIFVHIYCVKLIFYISQLFFVKCASQCLQGYQVRKKLDIKFYAYNMQRLELICLTLSANCFNRLYFTNCRMLLRTDISIGISNASPPSLTHGCARNIRNSE